MLWCNGLIREQAGLHVFFRGWAAKALSALVAGADGPAAPRAGRTAEWFEAHPLDSAGTLGFSVSREGDELVWLVTDILRCEGSCRTLKDLREHLGMVLDIAPVGIWMQDGTGKLSFVNRAFCEAMGIPESDFLAVEHYKMLLPEEFVPSCLASDAKALASDSPTITLQRLPMADGQIHDLEVYKAVHRNRAGEPVALVGVAIEATTKLADGLALRKAKETAESLSRAKSEFIKLMSHELLTPIHGILGLAEVLGDGEEQPDKREIVRGIQTSGDRLRRIVESILAYSRLDVRSSEESSVAFNIAESVETLFDDITGGGTRAGVSLNLEIDPELDRPVFGDVLSLNRVLRALLRNALAFTRQGEIRLSVCPGIREQGWIEVLFTLSDTGVGIPDSYMPHLFTPFKQGEDTLTRAHDGIGLDLALSKKLVDHRDGELLIWSAEGRGTTARLKLRFGCPNPATLP